MSALSKLRKKYADARAEYESAIRHDNDAEHDWDAAQQLADAREAMERARLALERAEREAAP